MKMTGHENNNKLVQQNDILKAGLRQSEVCEAVAMAEIPTKIVVRWSWKDSEVYFGASLHLNCNVLKNPRSVVDHCIWIQVTVDIVVIQVFKLSQLTVCFGHCHC